MEFLTGVTILVIYQLIGEVTALVLRLPVPGPVIGMALLFLTLVVRRGSLPALDGASASLLSHLSLLFVPAGVGVMVHMHRIGREWLPLLVALVVSTLLTLAVTALVMRATTRLQAREEAE